MATLRRCEQKASSRFWTWKLSRIGSSVRKTQTSSRFAPWLQRIRLAEHVWLQVSDTLLPALYGRDRRKNCFVPEIELVTAFWPFTTTGGGELVVQLAGETRFVVDCKVNPAALVDHVKITFVPE